MSFLPSKKVFIPVLIVGVILFFILAQKNKDGVKNIPEDTPEIFVRNPEISKIVTSDKDEDGLADWEESLWKTDPNNPDTDGDGTLDGEEIRLNRDPQVAGPNDNLDVTGGKQDSVTTDENLTATQQFSRDLFSGYAQLITNPQFKGDKTEVLYDYLSRNVSGVPKAKVYLLSDLNTTNSSDTQTNKNYGNALALNLKRGSVVNELAVMVRVFENRAKKDIDDLKKIIQINKDILERNLITKTPVGSAKIHLALINTHSSIIDSMVKVSEVNNDPLVAIIGLGEYSKNTKIFGLIVDDLKKYFTTKKIHFRSNEPGFVLIK